MRIVLVIIVATTCLGACTACGGSSNATSGRTTVVAAFYPLAWAAEEIGGSSVDVSNLTPPGAEPHDVELKPREVAELQRADIVLYLSHGFQPAVEQAAKAASGKRIDVLDGLGLNAGVGDEAGKTDPHVWLDPVLYAQVVRRIGAALGKPKPAARLAARVLALDREYRTGLAHCERRRFVTSHAAFGYLAARYGLEQLPITGIDPSSEPSPKRLAELARLVREQHIDTVFFERLVSPKLAEAVAREAGVKTAVLDPIEGLTPDEASAGDTYLTIMRRNLSELRQVLHCR
jgi:zinc transport system substrate-binding protein